MLPYLLMTLLSCTFAGMHDLVNRISKKNFDDRKKYYCKILLALTGLPLWFTSAFRSYSVGVDTFDVYYTDYISIKSGFDVHSDWGFQFINKIAINCHFGFRFVLIVSSFIFIYGALSLISECSDSMFTSTLLLIVSFNYMQSLSLIAQYTAIGVLCIALKELLKNRISVSVILTIIASLFHVSALYFLIIIFVFVVNMYAKNKFQNFCILSCVTVCIAIFSSVIIPFIVEGTRFKVYLNSSRFSELSSFSQVVINVCVAVFAFIALILQSRRGTVSGKDCVLAFIQIAAAVFALAQWEVVLLVRFVMYFSFYQYVCIPYFASKFKHKFLLQSLIIVSYCLWMIFYPLNGNYYNILPYHIGV